METTAEHASSMSTTTSSSSPRRRTTVRRLGRGMIYIVVGGLALAGTDELAEISRRIDVGRAALIAAISIGLLFAYVAHWRHGGRVRGNFAAIVGRVSLTHGVTLVTSVLVLALFARIDEELGALLILRRIVLVAFAASVAVGLSDAFHSRSS